jgi:hypothetical protein
LLSSEDVDVNIGVDVNSTISRNVSIAIDNHLPNIPDPTFNLWYCDCLVTVNDVTIGNMGQHGIDSRFVSLLVVG